MEKKNPTLKNFAWSSSSRDVFIGFCWLYRNAMAMKYCFIPFSASQSTNYLAGKRFGIFLFFFCSQLPSRIFIKSFSNNSLSSSMSGKYIVLLSTLLSNLSEKKITNFYYHKKSHNFQTLSIAVESFFRLSTSLPKSFSIYVLITFT